MEYKALKRDVTEVEETKPVGGDDVKARASRG